MRLIHTSDWHLGQNFYGKSRAKEHQHFLTWLLAQIEQQKIDAVIVAGDIFDTATPPSYAREMYFDFIAKIHQLNCQLIVIAGNHDSVAMLTEAKQVLSHLSTHVIALASDNEQEQVITLRNQQGEAYAIICAIPFIRPRDVLLSQAGQTQEQKQQKFQQAISDYYQKNVTYAKKCQSQYKQSVPIIATGHLTTVGASSSESVREIYIGTLEAFPASAFPEVDYIALGHIHRAQKVAKSERIRYSGSPIALSVDETVQEKQVFMIDFNEKGLASVTSLVIPCIQPLAMLKTDLDNLINEVDVLIKKFSTQLATTADKIWLDIEINSAEYLQDLQQRIEQLIDDKPIDILRVRRAKTAQQQNAVLAKKITLNELKEIDVFEQRLASENWQTPEQEVRKQRLITLFKQIINDVKTEQ